MGVEWLLGVRDARSRADASVAHAARMPCGRWGALRLGQMTQRRLAAQSLAPVDAPGGPLKAIEPLLKDVFREAQGCLDMPRGRAGLEGTAAGQQHRGPSLPGGGHHPGRGGRMRAGGAAGGSLGAQRRGGPLLMAVGRARQATALLWV